MKLVYLWMLFIATFLQTSCNNLSTVKNEPSSISDSVKSKMFCAAIANVSTAPNYVVIIVKNRKTAEQKEICTEAPFVSGAVDIETGISLATELDCSKYKNRYFEFAKDSALYNIGFDLYTKSELESYAKSLNILDIVQQVKNGKLTSKTFSGDRKEQRMFAHLMFNNGVMMTRGCVAGNVCGLSYFSYN
jgi:hypothetical protein